MRPMKDSGVEWIGDIPENWDVHFVKYAFSEVKNKNYDGKEKNALKFTNGEIVKKENFKADEDEYIADTILNYTVVNPNTIMINGLNLNYDLKSLRVGIVPERGIITSAYLALEPDEQKIYPQYANLLFKGYESKMALHNMGVGIRLTLGYKEFKRQPILVPPLYEQYKIAGFLKLKCTEIDNAISKTTDSIEEYKKLKQSIITKAVTKGIRGDRPMKDSGIEWVGEIPNGVPVSRVGLHFDIILGKMVCSKLGSDDMKMFPYICAADVHFDGVNTENLKEMYFTDDEMQTYSVRNGDLLVVEGGAGAGGAAVAKNINMKIGIQNSILIVREKENNRAGYLAYWLQSLVKRKYIDVVCNKATIPHYTKDKLANTPYIVFSAEEQGEIAEYLDSKCNEIDNIITKKQQLISELEAYKKSLIYEYVTGKKEVF